MANRFNQLIDYPEHVSSYVPLPLERIAAVGAMKQDLYDKAMAEYLDASKEIIGGNVTKDQAKFLNDRKDKDLSAMVDEAAKTDNYNQLKYQVKSYAEKLKSDPLYQGIEEDKKLSDAANKTILEQGSHVYVQDYWDPTANKYNQLDVSTPFTAGVYKTIKPGDPQKEFKPYYDQLHDIIKQTYGNDIQEQVNSDGSINLVQNGTKVVRSISRDELKTLARGLSKIDPNFNALDSFTYAEALNNKTNPNKKWSAEDNLDIFVNNYLNNKYEESDLQKVIRTIKADDDGSGGGGSGKGKTLVDQDNIYGDILDSIYTSKPKKDETGKTVETTGTTSVNDKQMASIVGGDIIDNNNITNLTGRKIYLTTPEQVVAEGKDIIDNKKAVYLYEELANMKKNIINGKLNPFIERLKNPQSPEAATGYIDPKTNDRYYLDAANNIHVQKNSEGPSKIFSTEEFITSQPEYQQVKLKALSQGIDLDSPEIQKSILRNTHGNVQVAAFNKALEAGVLNGNHVLHAAKDGDNIITDAEGNMYGRNYVELTENELDNILPDPWGPGAGWKDLRDMKDSKGNPLILKPAYRVNKDGSTTLVYQVPVTIQSSENTNDITRNSQLSIYGTDNTTQETINKLQQVNANKQNYYKGAAQANNISKALNSGAIKSTELISNLKNLNDPTGIIKQALDEVDKIKDVKSKNEQLADIWLLANNFDAWTSKHKSETPTNVGKQEEGWTKTAAKPLQ